MVLQCPLQRCASARALARQTLYVILQSAHLMPRAVEVVCFVHVGISCLDMGGSVLFSV